MQAQDTQLTCERCGDQFTGGERPWFAKYCSGRCKEAAKRDRQRARGHEPWKERRYWTGLTGDDRDYARILLNDPCSYCGASVRLVDHIVPRSRDGAHEWENLTAACDDCNRAKYTHDLLTFLVIRRLHSEWPGWFAQLRLCEADSADPQAAGAAA